MYANGNLVMTIHCSEFKAVNFVWRWIKNSNKFFKKLFSNM